jgi:SAM-dependent methyltransferase
MEKQSLPTPAELFELAYYADLEKDHRLLRFLERHLARHRSGALLDCACGTGEPTLHLHNLFSVTISDASVGMLLLAKLKARRMGLSGVRIFCARWSDLTTVLSTRFDVVMCAGNSLSQCILGGDRKAALMAMANVLADSGTLYIDFRDFQDNCAATFTAVDVRGPLLWQRRRLLLVVYERSIDGLIERLKVCYDIGPGGLTHYASALTVYAPLSRATLCHDLNALGFNSLLFRSRPGRWPLTAVFARRKP